MFDAFPQMRADNPQFFGGGHQFLEATRNGADASRDVARKQLGKKIEKQVRVSEARFRGPIGKVNLFLNASAVKGAVRKSIDGKDVTLVLAKPTLKFQQLLTVAEFLGRLSAQAKPNRVRPVRADLFPHRQTVLLQGRESFGPGFPAMNIGAIREMKAVVEFHVCLVISNQ